MAEGLLVGRSKTWEVGEFGLEVLFKFRKSQNIPDEFQKYFTLFISLKEVKILGFAPAWSRGCFCDLSMFSRAGKQVSCSTLVFPGLIFLGWGYSHITIIYIHISKSS